MCNLAVELNLILGHLLRLNRPIINSLHPPLSKSNIEKKMDDVGLVNFPDLITLYSWRNGTVVTPGDVIDNLHFFPGFYFLSLQDSLNSYSVFCLDERWDKNWIPLFANGGGDFYAIDLDNTRDSFGQIVGFILNETEQDIEFESLLTMCKTISTCYQTGAYFVQDEYLEVNDTEMYQIAVQLNPSLDIYKML